MSDTESEMSDSESDVSYDEIWNDENEIEILNPPQHSGKTISAPPSNYSFSAEDDNLSLSHIVSTSAPVLPSPSEEHDQELADGETYPIEATLSPSEEHEQQMANDETYPMITTLPPSTPSHVDNTSNSTKVTNIPGNKARQQSENGVSILQTLARVMSHGRLSQHPSRVAHPARENQGQVIKPPLPDNDSGSLLTRIMGTLLAIFGSGKNRGSDVTSQTSAHTIHRATSALEALSRAVSAFQEFQEKATMIVDKEESRRLVTELRSEQTSTSSLENISPSKQPKVENEIGDDSSSTSELFKYENMLSEESSTTETQGKESGYVLQTQLTPQSNNVSNESPQYFLNKPKFKDSGGQTDPEQKVAETQTSPKPSADDTYREKSIFMLEVQTKPASNSNGTGEALPREKSVHELKYKESWFQTDPEQKLAGTQTSLTKIISKSPEDTQQKRASVSSSNIGTSNDSETFLNPIPDTCKCPKCDLFEQMFRDGGQKVRNDPLILEMFKRHRNSHLQKVRTEVEKLNKWIEALNKIEKAAGIPSLEGATENYHSSVDYEGSLNSRIYSRNTSERSTRGSSIDEGDPILFSPRSSQEYRRSFGSTKDDRQIARNCSEEWVKRTYCHSGSYRDKKGNERSYDKRDDSRSDSHNRIQKPRSGNSNMGCSCCLKRDRDYSLECCCRNCERPRAKTACCHYEYEDVIDDENYKCLPRRRRCSKEQGVCKNEQDDSIELTPKMRGYITGMMKGLIDNKDLTRNINRSQTNSRRPSDSGSSDTEETLGDKIKSVNNIRKNANVPPSKDSPREASSRNENPGSVLKDMAAFMIRMEDTKQNGNDNRVSQSKISNPVDEEYRHEKAWVTGKADIQESDLSAQSQAENDGNADKGNEQESSKLGGENSKSREFDLNDPDVQEFVSDVLTVFCSEFLKRETGCEAETETSSYPREINQPQLPPYEICSPIQCSDVSEHGTYSYAYYPVCNNNINRDPCCRAGGPRNICLNEDAIEICPNESFNVTLQSSNTMPLQEAFKRFHTVCYQRVQTRQQGLSNLRRERGTQQRERTDRFPNYSRPASSPLPSSSARTQRSFCRNSPHLSQNTTCEAITYVVPHDRVYWHCK